MSTICVTGAAGFVGGHVALACAAAGHDVRATVRDPSGRRAATVQALAGERLRFFAADLSEPGSFDEALAGCDVVIHTAAPVTEDVADLEAEFIRPALDGTRALLEASLRTGVRAFCITLSTDAIGVGQRHGGGKFSEKDDNTLCRRDYGTYGWVKRELARLVQAFCDSHGIRSAMLFPALVFGPTLTGELAASLRTVEVLVRRRVPLVPALHFDWVDVRDVAAAHLAVATNPSASGRFIVARGESLGLPDVARVIAAEFPDLRVPVHRLPRWVLRAASLFDRRLTPYYLDHVTCPSSGFDGTRLCRELGYTYRHDLRTSLRDSVQAILQASRGSGP